MPIESRHQRSHARSKFAAAILTFLVAASPAFAETGDASTCAPGDSGPCDDGRDCTSDDRCSDGECAGKESVIPATCHWAMVDGDASGTARTRARNQVNITGSICGQSIRVDGGAAITGNVVTTAASGRGVMFGPAASVDGDIVTAGASINGTSRRVRLPGVEETEVPGGTSMVQDGNTGLDLDATGPNPLAEDCQDAIDSIKPSTTLLDSTAFRSTDSMSDLTVPNRGQRTLLATRQINVIDFRNLTANDWSTITLDGNSIPGVVFVLRVNRKLSLEFHSSIVLTGGATAERVVLYGRQECRIGQNVTGAGTVFCPYDTLKVGHSTVWEGAMVSGGDRIELRHHVELNHTALEVSVP